MGAERPGVQCEETAESTGNRCRARAFARVRITGGAVFDEPQTAWLCGNHQHRLRSQGCRVTLIEKWRQVER